MEGPDAPYKWVNILELKSFLLIDIPRKGELVETLSQESEILAPPS